MNVLRSPISQYVSIAIFFILLTVLLPANQMAMEAYHLSSAQYHILLFTVTVPFVAVWYAAFYGYNRIKQYAAAITKSSEGEDFNALAKGIGWLAWALVIPAVTSILLGSLGDTFKTIYRPTIIISNYLYLVLPMIAYLVLASSVTNLVSHAKVRLSALNTKGLIALFVALGVVFCYLLFRQLGSSTLTATDNIYYLPVWLIISTLVIPYLFSWFVGLLAAYEILLFAKQSRGLLYRRGLQFLGSGIAVVIASSIAFQYVTAVVPRTGHLSLNVTLAAIYLIRILAAAGYIFIAIGASRLKRIEEV